MVVLKGENREDLELCFFDLEWYGGFPWFWRLNKMESSGGMMVQVPVNSVIPLWKIILPLLSSIIPFFLFCERKNLPHCLFFETTLIPYY